MEKALVKWNTTPAGVLIETSEGFVFTYLAEYLADPRLPAISVHLPKRPEPYFSAALFPIFRDLLTEGANQAAQERQFGIPGDALMRRLCLTSVTDTVGSLTLSPLP
jgi:serine/threonine-protein kinase HipA